MANRGQGRVNNKDNRHLPKTRPFLQNGSVFGLIALGASFRDPYPAFSAAIRARFAEGGLLCYGASLKGEWRHFGYFIDEILKGTKPGDIPVEEPTIFEMIVNARTAKLFDLTLPGVILVGADEVIE